MLEHQLMNRLVQVLGERRRLWPPDQGSSVASIGLLGWMQSMYLRPDRMEREARGWMWLSGLLESESKTPTLHRSAKSFDTGDQRAIDAYASAVAGALFQVTGRHPAEWPEASRGIEWQPQEIEMLTALGAKHGDVVRDMFVGVLANHGGWHVRDMPVRDPRSASFLDDAAIDDQEERTPGLDALLRKCGIRDAALLKGIRKDPPRRSS